MRPGEAAARLPELVFRGRLDMTFDGVPLSARGLGWRRRVNLLLAGGDLVRRGSRALARPTAVQIEPSALCNLTCPLCPTGRGDASRPRGMMTMEMFTQVLDSLGRDLILAILYGWGEPFLNPDLPRMIRACTSRGILTVTSTNGHPIRTIDEALAVVDAGLSALIVALDGSRQEIYSRYRQGGDMEKVKRCVSLIEEAKARRGSSRPYTDLRVVVTRDNQDDLPNLEAIAREAGTNMFSSKSLGKLTETDAYEVYEATRADVRRRPEGRIIGHGPVRCPFPFRQPTVFWDGTMVGCEFDNSLEIPWGRPGEEPLAKFWNGRPARELRRRVARGVDLPEFCGICPYRDLSRESTVLSCKELRPIPGR
jgi:MoaA/NifB/PqqE/SkfB family radical SAM enzyme